MKEYKSIENVLRMFISRYNIKWVAPSIKKEIYNYFENPEVSSIFSKHDLKFENEKELYRFLSKGTLTTLSPEVIQKLNNLSNTIDEINDKLKDQTYSQAFKEIEHKLERGDLILEAPIVIKFKDDSYWVYSGRKRIYVARKNGVPVQYFLIKQSK